MTTLPSALRPSQFSSWRLFVLAACFILPFLGFVAVGSLWLYERDWLRWAALIFAGGEALAFFLFRRWIRNDRAILPQPSVSPPSEFSPREEAAWVIVQEYQTRIDQNEIVLSSLEQLLTLGKEIMNRVAVAYRPEEKEPLLAVQIPLLFRAIEETARDLATVTASLPLAHRITISEIMRGYRFSQKMQPAYELYQLYRWLSPLINPQSGIFRMLINDRLFDLTKETLNQWLLKWYIDRVGYHAIELYSGKLLLTHRDSVVGEERANLLESKAQRERKTVASLQILVLGQVKAGKSSLVNALFGEVKAATDSVPTTMQLTPYVFERPGVDGKIILCDMGGYEDPSAPPERKAQALAEALLADLVIVVLSAVNAAREPDRQLVADLRAYFDGHPELRPPPIIIALTHIDLLRPPLEWAPPYNIASPNSLKARSIRGALETVAADLGVQPSLIIPLCVLPERIYNVEEALLPLLVQLLPEAKRVLLLRSLKTLREQEQWDLLWKQAKATGRFLFEIGREVLKKSVEKILTEGRRG